MKTKLFILILLIVCFSCGTNNKPLSDAQKDKIKAEVKQVADRMFQGCEEANFDIAGESFLDSPDYVFLINGYALNYKESLDAIKPVFASLLSQKVTIVEEKYAILDKTTVLYTANTKFLENFKDGHSVLNDPTVILCVFKKIDNKWKTIYAVESYISQGIVGSETTKELNQVELLEKFIGNWEIPAGKDTTELVTFKNLIGEQGLSVYAKWMTKGKTFMEATGFWAFDATINKIDVSVVLSTGEVIHDHGLFTTPNTFEYVNINKAKVYKGISKIVAEFISPDEYIETITANYQTEPISVKRIK